MDGLAFSPLSTYKHSPVQPRLCPQTANGNHCSAAGFKNWNIAGLFPIVEICIVHIMGLFRVSIDHIGLPTQGSDSTNDWRVIVFSNRHGRSVAKRVHLSEWVNGKESRWGIKLEVTHLTYTRSFVTLSSLVYSWIHPRCMYLLIFHLVMCSVV